MKRRIDKKQFVVLLVLVLCFFSYFFGKYSSWGGGARLDVRVPALAFPNSVNSSQESSESQIAPEPREAIELSVGLYLGRIDDARNRLSGESRYRALLAAGLEAIERLGLEDAVEVIENLEGESVHEDLCQELAIRFARVNPEAGIEWVVGLSGYSWHGSISKYFGENADPDKLLGILSSQDYGLRKVDYENLVVESVAKKGETSLSDALELLQGNPYKLSESALRNSVLTSIALSVHSGDVASAIANIEKAEAYAGRDEIIGRLATQWASSDTEGMAIWLKDNPASDIARMSIGMFVDRWALVDAEEASRWLVSVPSSSMRDEGIASLVNSLAQTNPEDAILWVQELSDSYPSKAQLESAILRRIGETKS